MKAGCLLSSDIWNKVVLIPGLFLLCRPTLAGAAEVMPGSETPDLFSASIKMFGALGLLIGGLLLALYLLRRLGLARAHIFGGQEMIRVIATRSLAPRKFIALVEIGGSVLTLGITNDHISCLDKVAADAFRTDPERETTPPAGPGFAQRLKAVTGFAAQRPKDHQT